VTGGVETLFGGMYGHCRRKRQRQDGEESELAHLDLR
jgi:hypothetical protein